MTALLTLEDVTKRYARDRRCEVTVLRRVSFALAPGESVGVIGMERAGKSTLLRILAGALAPDEGVVRFREQPLSRLSDAKRAAIVRAAIGLADPATVASTRCERVVDHVALPLLAAGASPREAGAAARRTLAQLGAAECADLLPHELTRAETVRVAVARALVRDPEVLLFDEPAAMPRADDIEAITRTVRTLARTRGFAVVTASQDPLALRGADRIVHLSNGELRTSDRRATVVPFPRSPHASLR